jgi:hypothetical protein
MVFNDNSYPLTQLYKGEEVEIKSKDYWRDTQGAPKVMDIFEAAEFKGAYSPVPLDSSGRMVPDAKYHKIIRLDPAGTAAAAPVKIPCMAHGCGEKFDSEAQLAQHSSKEHDEIAKLALPDQDSEIKTKRGKA